MYKINPSPKMAPILGPNPRIVQIITDFQITLFSTNQLHLIKRNYFLPLSIALNMFSLRGGPFRRLLPVDLDFRGQPAFFRQWSRLTCQDQLVPRSTFN